MLDRYLKYIYIVLFFLIIFSLFLLHINVRYFFVLLVIQLLLFLPLLIIKPHYLAILFIFVFSIFPQTDWYDVFPKIGFMTSFVIFFAMIFFLMFKTVVSTSYSKYFLIFFVFVIFSAIRGVMYGNQKFFIVEEMLKYLYYPISFFFVVTFSDNWESVTQFIKTFLFSFIIVSLIISIEILFLYFSETQGTRVLTRQSNIIFVGLIISIVLIKNNRFNKALKLSLIASSILYTVSILITMQRSLWIGTLFSIFLFVTIDIIIHKVNVKNIILLIVILILVFGGSYTFFQKINISGDQFSERTDNIQDVENVSSLVIRLISYLKVYDTVKHDLILGKGLGHTIKIRLLSLQPKNLVDNSYISLIWKMGIIGLIIFMLLIIIMLKQFFFILRNNKDPLMVNTSIIITCVFGGQLINSLACVAITQYNYNYIWASLIALHELIYLNTIRKKELIVST